MKILVDADACPTKDEIIYIAQKYNVPVIFISCFAHKISVPERYEVVVVDNEKDETDYAIVNRTYAGDIVVTQDYGLAAMVLAKKGYAISPRGHIYKDSNITGLLTQRHIGQKIRKSGGRTKGPKALKKEDREKFLKKFDQLVKLAISKN
jgi:uncharacterized protein YaiI (UPF0178 family)